MGDMMAFPASVEEFMEQYKMTDTEHVYSNGTEYVPIYRMKQWFEHCRNHQLLTIDAVPVVRCENACCTETAPRKMLSYLQELIIRSAVLEKGKEVLTDG